MLRPQSDREARGEAQFRRFHAAGVTPPMLDYLRLCLTERRDLFRDLALGGRRLSPFLEIGAEAGANSLLLADDLGAEGLALDLSRDALAAMPAYARALGVTRLPARAWGDAYALPLRNNSVSFAVAWGTLHHLPDPRPALAELRRALAPGGLLVVGDEPVRRLLSLHLGRTPSPRSFSPAQRWMLKLRLLPWLYDLDGREAVEAGAAEMQFTRRQYRRWLTAAFERVEMTDFPYLHGLMRSAGPLGRLLLAPLGPTLAGKAETTLFGGAIGARCVKAPERGWRALADGRLLLRKRPGHDALRARGEGLAGARWRLDGEEVAAIVNGDGDEARLTLPPAAVRRGTVLVSAAGAVLRQAAFTGGGLPPHWVAPPADPAPAGSVDDALACPACWEIGGACRADWCGGACLRFALAGTLRLVDGRAALTAPTADPGPDAALACPVAAIDRPRLIREADARRRCPQCGQAYQTADEVMDLRSPRARRALA